jgi:two-component system, LuxR family, response regulator FixJ
MLERQSLVLVAHDDEAVRDALQFALQLENLEVHVHRSGAELVLNRDLPRASCLILREHMPDMDGLQVMHHLRARHLILPAILLTAHATPRLQARAEAAGIVLILEKPILDNALLEGVLTITSRGKPAKHDPAT